VPLPEAAGLAGLAVPLYCSEPLGHWDPEPLAEGSELCRASELES